MKYLFAALVVILTGPGWATAQERVPFELAGPLTRPALEQTTWKSPRPYHAQADTTIAYDDGSNSTVGTANQPEVYLLEPEARQANRFVRPLETTLSLISVAPYYANDFVETGVPDSLIRNFRLMIWAHHDSLPGDELFALEVEDDRRNDDPAGRFTFLDIDLSAYKTEMAALPDTFYVGLTDLGPDTNYVYMGVSEYLEGDTISFAYRSSFYDGQGGWRRFQDLSSAEAGSLAERVLPIRATFSSPDDEPTASEGKIELPERIALHANYPNPFNPATTIAYDLPRSGTVRLAVFDLLGRERAVLVDGPQAAGRHTARLDATGWASGLYLYRLEAAGQRQTRRMMLVK